MSYANPACRRQIEKSLLAQIEMSLSTASVGEYWADDGDYDEPDGDRPDGRLAIRHNGIDLPYRTFDKRPQVNQAAIVENKRLGPVLAYIAEKQKELDMSRSAKAPSRRGQKNHMFKVG
jgi:hypothetical protein